MKGEVVVLSLKAGNQAEFFLLGKLQSLPSSSSPDRMRPSHVVDGDLPSSKVTDLNVDPI